MAATVSSPWAKPGAWALDAEEHEDELKQQHQQELNSKVSSGAESDFPSLSAAATKQTKKKKSQPISLAEFNTYGAAKPSSAYQPKGLTHEDILSLPTGPRQRSAEELESQRSRLGGGFKSYGGGMSSNGRSGEDSSNSSRWGGGSRVPRDSSSSRELLAPSRADEIDDWSKMKKTPSFGNERRERGERERGSSFFDSQSKADESESWVSNKAVETRRFGGGFERRGSFDSLSRGDRFGSSNGGGGADDSDSWGRRREESNGIGGGIGGGSATARPKLVLQPRSLPVSNENDGGAKPKGSSPFGDARPREEVLAEKGKDWKEIDEKLESVKISGAKEVERGAWSFSNGRADSGREPRTWRKPDVAADDSNSRPESAAASENGNVSENGHNTEGEHADGN
ncbi:eukaryotic translation initiation factor 4B3 [Mercurialis annua]|uniref:eukaryotic translation initiation factor 4B3 n=1 Tax=Mercurialis annua TaxID=3986 RepID=UPI00216055C1|nr:eukaryotic translation initiation factor 4B3 [Mercurialis annua]